MISVFLNHVLQKKTKVDPTRRLIGLLDLLDQATTHGSLDGTMIQNLVLRCGEPMENPNLRYGYV